MLPSLLLIPSSYEDFLSPSCLLSVSCSCRASSFPWGICPRNPTAEQWARWDSLVADSIEQSTKQELYCCQDLLGPLHTVRKALKASFPVEFLTLALLLWGQASKVQATEEEFRAQLCELATPVSPNSWGFHNIVRAYSFGSVLFLTKGQRVQTSSRMRMFGQRCGY